MKKRILSLCLVVFAVALVGACSEGSNSNPVAPAEQSSNLTSVASGVRSNSVPVTLCHNNPDYAEDGGFEWQVIEVDDNSSGKHVDKHGDYTTGTCINLSTLDVGVDCSCCTTASCGGI